MAVMRIALANLTPGTDREDALARVLRAIDEAAAAGAAIVCFSECYLPGYRIGFEVEAFDEAWLQAVWAQVDLAAGNAAVAVVLGTERMSDAGLHITVRVTDASGQCLGFQDKVQLDPSEEATYVAGVGRRVFEAGGATFGVVICHEGWRYPETVRWGARAGAQLVFHPHVEIFEPGATQQSRFADPANTFHEKAMLCRAAENTVYFASVNAALPASTTTSAVVDPEGRLIAHQPYGESGLLVADLDLDQATGLLAGRLRPQGPVEGDASRA